ncbi:hypothetical protein [Metapseudomonas furukawaii]|jgi:hypothetical protein|uniref:Uncharacterized protein n=1 Tax=Metapseudomonas furukawaii TaxID=1149133 RepID=A0AAD1BXL9_METFU|nr:MULTISPECIES: hypothetical protein [Pseudomonas]ELS29918.1 hypothetical protein ppKF707_5460 [Pseudomonas furukawaii]OWJ94713.1 hypothetical protein B6S59_13515 [Pseudomonas sp. A46]WAG79139.1 hypothetical protein LMK08_00275 [Pseudomonas furukawaii]BAU71694.1 hypothetical protein KF707C_60 [Pseudomonas furukawaii]
MSDEKPQSSTSDEEISDYMIRQLRSGRVKPAVLVVLTEKNFPDVDRERIIRCFNALDSGYLKG